MTTDDIKAMQSRLHITADGFWGPKSIASCQAWLRKLMPDPNPWPEQYEMKLQAFYGSPGDESKLVSLPVTGVLYEGQPVSTIRCHAKVAASLGRIIAELAAGPFAWILTKYDGCFNFRNMRGGAIPSLHARGGAIDFWADKNGNQDHWPDQATMPLEIMEIFAREGWLSAGANWGRDGMHFQATR